MASAFALVSLWFGIWKKSTPATIIAGTIIASIICNFLSVSLSMPTIAVSITVLGLIIGGYTSLGISRKIEIMEV
jgi:hypothetical protein